MSSPEAADLETREVLLAKLAGPFKASLFGAPATVLEGANKETAEKAKAQIEEAGGTVVLK